MLRPASLLVALVAATGHDSARAQPPNYSYASLHAQCDGGTMRVTFTAYDRGEHPEIVGFHIDRATYGDCAAPVRVTTAPLDRAAGMDFAREVVDPGADPSLMHDYFLVAVDAQGNESNGYQLYSVLASQLSHSNSCSASAPIAHGRVEDQGWALLVFPCPDGCFGVTLLDEFPQSLRDLAGTETQVLVHGSFVCGTVEGCLGRVASYSTTPCVVGIEAGTWSAVKRLYGPR